MKFSLLLFNFLSRTLTMADIPVTGKVESRELPKDLFHPQTYSNFWKYPLLFVKL